MYVCLLPKLEERCKGTEKAVKCKKMYLEFHENKL